MQHQRHRYCSVQRIDQLEIKCDAAFGHGMRGSNGDGQRDIARIGVRLSQASDVTLTIRKDGEDVATLEGWVRESRAQGRRRL